MRKKSVLSFVNVEYFSLKYCLILNFLLYDLYCSFTYKGEISWENMCDFYVKSLCSKFWIQLAKLSYSSIHCEIIAFNYIITRKISALEFVIVNSRIPSPLQFRNSELPYLFFHGSLRPYFIHQS